MIKVCRGGMMDHELLMGTLSVVLCSQWQWMGQSRTLEEHSMAPQRGLFKKLSRDIQDIQGLGVTKALGHIAFCMVLVGQLGASSAAASGLGFDGLSGDAESLATVIVDSDTLHQSDPDCKYPPCD
ncbi:MAG: hypothetical protein AAF329_28715 [Cyanobacteria bacterium P01_A01_bin.17]